MVIVDNSEAFHRKTPTLLTDQLYLSAYIALSYQLLVELGITCVINATLELPTMANQKHDAMQIAVEDRVASKLHVYFDLVADKIHSVHRSGGKVMIYCRAGMSRSASLCIAYFMRYRGMNLEDAFNYVKDCRPIIHPNVGFMRQLREYEAKVLARRSRQKLGLISIPAAAGVKRKHSIAMGRGPLIPGEPLPDIVFAEEEIEIECMTEIYTRDEIPPRPKPRIPKPKPWIPERLMETYQTTTVQVLGDVDMDVEEQHTSTNKRGLSVSQPQTPHFKHKSRRGRHHSQQHNAAVSINQSNMLGVAESRCDTPLIDICCAVNDGSQNSIQRGANIAPTAPPRRKPFTKISMEPTKIAVSSLTIPLGLGAEYSKGQKLGKFFSRETAISISSHLTGCKGEGVLVAVQEFEEIVFECCAVGLPSDIPSQTVISSSNPTDTLLSKSSDTNNSSHVALTSRRNDSYRSSNSLSSSTNYRHYSQRHHPYSASSSRFSSSKATQATPVIAPGKARTVLYQPKTGVAVISLVHVLECPGIYQKQNLPGDASNHSILNRYQQPKSTSSSKVPSRFASLSSSRYVQCY